MIGSSNDRFRRIDAIFDQALDLPPDQRIFFLAEIRACDPTLCADVLRLLRAYERSADFLESPAVDVAGPLFREDDHEPDTGG